MMRRRVMFHSSVCGIIGAVVLGIAAPVITAGQGRGLWTMGGQNRHNTRYAPTEDRIGVHNAFRLTTKWVFPTSGDVSATPAVEDNAVYVPDWGGTLYKVNAKTGQQIWARPISSYTGISTPGPGVTQPASRTAPAIVGNTLIIGSHRGAYIIAVNKHNGNLLWKTQADTHPHAIITQSPVVSGDRVYIGVSSAESLLGADSTYHAAPSAVTSWHWTSTRERSCGGLIWRLRGTAVRRCGEGPPSLTRNVMQSTSPPGTTIRHLRVFMIASRPTTGPRRRKPFAWLRTTMPMPSLHSTCIPAPSSGDGVCSIMTSGRWPVGAQNSASPPWISVRRLTALTSISVRGPTSSLWLTAASPATCSAPARRVGFIGL